MSTPETEVSVKPKSSTFEMSKRAYVINTTILLVALLFSTYDAVKNHITLNACEDFWKEKCTHAYVPVSIESNFSKDYYDSVKH